MPPRAPAPELPARLRPPAPPPPRQIPRRRPSHRRRRPQASSVALLLSSVLFPPSLSAPSLSLCSSAGAQTPMAEPDGSPLSPSSPDLPTGSGNGWIGWISSGSMPPGPPSRLTSSSHRRPLPWPLSSFLLVRAHGEDELARSLRLHAWASRPRGLRPPAWASPAAAPAAQLLPPPIRPQRPMGELPTAPPLY